MGVKESSGICLVLSIFCLVMTVFGFAETRQIYDALAKMNLQPPDGFVIVPHELKKLIPDLPGQILVREEYAGLSHDVQDIAANGTTGPGMLFLVL